MLRPATAPPATSRPSCSNGLLAPAGAPRDVLSRLQAEIAKAVAAPALSNSFLERGVELTASGSPDEFTAYIRNEMAASATATRTVARIIAPPPASSDASPFNQRAS